MIESVAPFSCGAEGDTWWLFGFNPAVKPGIEEIADEEQRSISQISELFLKGAVEDYKKDGPQYIQRLLAKQKHKASK